MVIFFLRMMMAPEKRNEVLQIARSITEPTKAELGCSSCRFFQDIGDSNALSLIEEWESSEYFERHIHSKEFRKVLVLIDNSTKEPVIKIVTDGICITGIEAFRQIYIDQQLRRA